MESEERREWAHIWRPAGLEGVELLHARYVRHAFSLHTHEQYAVGVIEEGALAFSYLRAQQVAPCGFVNLCIPGEVHNGYAATPDGWTYRMFYLDTGLVRQVAEELTGHPCGYPYFRSGVLADAALARQIRSVHARLDAQPSARLAAQCQLVQMLAALIGRHASPLPPPGAALHHPGAVQRVKEYLAAHYQQDVSLDELCRLTHLTRFHLVRSFHEAVGVPPHAYLRQVRIQQARQRLLSGEPIAAVAAATGFSDQSHLTRWLKRLWGVTPGEYRNSVQDVQG